MIIESGVIIFIGMLLLAIKLPTKTSLKLLGYPLLLDFSVSAIAFIMHYGTFSGVMAAAVAGMMCSGFTSIARYAFGYIRSNKYYPGRIWRLDPAKLN
jgi:hypothetical protein